MAGNELKFLVDVGVGKKVESFLNVSGLILKASGKLIIE